MRKKRSRQRRARIGLSVAAAGATAAAVAAGATYVRGRRMKQPYEPAAGSSAQPAAQQTEGQAPAQSSAQPSTDGDQEHATWTCQCGQEFRVSGRDRHRLYWLPDAKPEDPVLDDRCPSCDRQLSAEQAA